MLNSISQLNGSKIAATDGDLGHVEEAYFDEKAWAIRYLVVNTGSWLSGREVLISPYSVRQPLSIAGGDKLINVTLNQRQVENSPPIDTHQPVSRRHERDYLNYYAYPEYWVGGDLWAMGSLPMLRPAMPGADPAVISAIGESRLDKEPYSDKDVPAEDVHLRSSAHVASYDIQAIDGSIGHVKDFIFDDESWAIRYLVIDTRNWWPGGKKVLLATKWIDHIDWAEKAVFTKLTREQIKSSPEYDEAAVIDRKYEEKLHESYGRDGYWL